MPLYDYKCSNCSYQEEVLQGINDQPLSECPTCNEPRFKRQATAPSFTFKGGGWYKDLYGSAGSSAKSETTTPAASAASSDSSAASSSPAASTTPSKSTSSDSKPAASAST